MEVQDAYVQGVVETVNMTTEAVNVTSVMEVGTATLAADTSHQQQTTKTQFTTAPLQAPTTATATQQAPVTTVASGV
eukprot:3332118-Rhodomonas_salina.3